MALTQKTRYIILNHLNRELLTVQDDIRRMELEWVKRYTHQDKLNIMKQHEQEIVNAIVEIRTLCPWGHDR